jgi:predicted transcriptional regulator
MEPEGAIVEAVEEGLADMRAGRVVGHDEVVTELDDIIAQAEARA